MRMNHDLAVCQRWLDSSWIAFDMSALINIKNLLLARVSIILMSVISVVQLVPTSSMAVLQQVITHLVY